MHNICPICQLEFSDWATYHEHLSLAHAVTHREETQKEEPIIVDIFEAMQLKITPPGQKKQYIPMNPAEKRCIVMNWENKQKKGVIIQ